MIFNHKCPLKKGSGLTSGSYNSCCYIPNSLCSNCILYTFKYEILTTTGIKVADPVVTFCEMVVDTSSFKLRLQTRSEQPTLVNVPVHFFNFL